MADEDKDQKTEAPTGKRLDEARERGQIPVSREMSNWVVLLGIVVVVGWVLPHLALQLVDILRVFVETPHLYALDENNVQSLMLNMTGQVGLAIGISLLVLIAAVVGGVMIQTGFFFAPDLLTPDLMKLSPMNGLKRLFSITALAELFKSFGKMVFLGGIAFVVLVPVATQAPSMTGMPLDIILTFLESKTLHLIIMLLLAFTVIALGDLFFIRFQYIKNLRMTKQEVKDEFKQQEGDPVIKSRLRQMRVEKARKRMMAQVPKADVIITNPTHYAIALQYDGGKMSAPIVIAKGINLIAERIRAVAEEHRIPLVSNPPLARALHDSVEINQQIPSEHYRAVAEVISYVYKLRKRKW